MGPGDNTIIHKNFYILGMSFTISIIFIVMIIVYIHHEVNIDGDGKTVEFLLAQFKSYVEFSSRSQILIVLFAFHALQMLFFFPFMNITKMMYGYFFGIWHGAIICFCYETILLLGYIFTVFNCIHSFPGPYFLRNLIEYIDLRRKRAYFSIFILLLNMSSLPLATKSALVVSLSITPLEFIGSNLANMLLTSLRDICWGNILSYSHFSTAEIPFYTVVVIFNAFLPTLISIWILVEVSRQCGGITRESIAENDTVLSITEENSHSKDTVVIDAPANENLRVAETSTRESAKSDLHVEARELLRTSQAVTLNTVADDVNMLKTPSITVERPTVTVQVPFTEMPPRPPPRREKSSYCPKPCDAPSGYLV